jgi:hypothetical protein
MTTVVVARKGGQVAIAGDSLVTFGDTRSRMVTRPTTSCSRWASRGSGCPARRRTFPVLRVRSTASTPDELRLGSRDEVFDTFLRLHPKLKDTFFLNTKEEDADPYESSQFTVLVANTSGIYGCTRTARCSSSTASGRSAPAGVCARCDVHELRPHEDRAGGGRGRCSRGV